MPQEGRPLDTVADIDTPERMCFSCRLAGPGPRALAYAIDGALRVCVLGALGMVALGGDVAGWDLSGLGTGLALVALFVLDWGYYVACELWMNGQSLGKRALGLRVVSADGLPIGLRESALRNLLRAADFLPTLNVLGALVMSLDPRFRRLGDLVAGTIVIVESREPMLPAIQLSPAPTPEELNALPAHVAFTPDERDAVEHLMRRKSSLSEARAAELALLLAPVLARRLQLTYRDPVRFLGLLHQRATRARSS